MPDRRFQVFVSSTFTDLQGERQEILHALLELGCFPAGMEFFPASSSTAWAHIERVIDDSDYYVVVVGGRYGSVSSDGLSFTEREYEYATSRGIPVLAFIHGDRDSLPWRDSEHDATLRERLSTFVSRLQEHHTVRFWRSASDLKASVMVSLTQQLDTHPRPGWVRESESPLRRSTLFEVKRHAETMLMRDDGFDNEVTLDIQAAGPGLEVFFRQVWAGGYSVLQDIEVQTPGMTLLRPFVGNDTWAKAFVHLGRQLASGEATTVVMREIYTQDGPWEQENIHGYYAAHNLERLELVLAYPDHLRPKSATWREYLGDADLGELLDAGQLDVSGNRLTYVISTPSIGHNYAIEWTM